MSFPVAGERAMGKVHPLEEEGREEKVVDGVDRWSGAGGKKGLI